MKLTEYWTLSIWICEPQNTVFTLEMKFLKLHNFIIKNMQRIEFRVHKFSGDCISVAYKIQNIYGPYLLYVKLGPDAKMQTDSVHLISRIKTVTFGLWYIQERTSHSCFWKAAELLWSSENVSSSTANLLCPSHVLSPFVHYCFLYFSSPFLNTVHVCSAPAWLIIRARMGEEGRRVEGVSTLASHPWSAQLITRVRPASLFSPSPPYPRTD